MIQGLDAPQNVSRINARYEDWGSMKSPYMTVNCGVAPETFQTNGHFFSFGYHTSCCVCNSWPHWSLLTINIISMPRVNVACLTIIKRYAHLTVSAMCSASQKSTVQLRSQDRDIHPAAVMHAFPPPHEGPDHPALQEGIPQGHQCCHQESGQDRRSRVTEKWRE